MSFSKRGRNATQLIAFFNVKISQTGETEMMDDNPENSINQNKLTKGFLDLIKTTGFPKL